nr:translation initiation factor IF-2 [Oryctolagus cuniculus]
MEVNDLGQLPHPVMEAVVTPGDPQGVQPWGCHGNREPAPPPPTPTAALKAKRPDSSPASLNSFRIQTLNSAHAARVQAGNAHGRRHGLRRPADKNGNHSSFRSELQRGFAPAFPIHIPRQLASPEPQLPPASKRGSPPHRPAAAKNRAGSAQQSSPGLCAPAAALGPGSPAEPAVPGQAPPSASTRSPRKRRRAWGPRPGPGDSAPGAGLAGRGRPAPPRRLAPPPGPPPPASLRVLAPPPLLKSARPGPRAGDFLLRRPRARSGPTSPERPRAPAAPTQCRPAPPGALGGARARSSHHRRSRRRHRRRPAARRPCPPRRGKRGRAAVGSSPGTGPRSRGARARAARVSAAACFPVTERPSGGGGAGPGGARGGPRDFYVPPESASPELEIDRWERRSGRPGLAGEGGWIRGGRAWGPRLTCSAAAWARAGLGGSRGGAGAVAGSLRVCLSKD